jgi:hypothetical protein
MNKYTTEQLQAAREYAASINHALADNVFSDDAGFADHVTDEGKREYAAKNKQIAKDIEAGKKDHNLTVRQRMEYFLTGTSTALLS